MRCIHLVKTCFMVRALVDALAKYRDGAGECSRECVKEGLLSRLRAAR